MLGSINKWYSNRKLRKSIEKDVYNITEVSINSDRIEVIPDNVNIRAIHIDGSSKTTFSGSASTLMTVLLSDNRLLRFQIDTFSPTEVVSSFLRSFGAYFKKIKLKETEEESIFYDKTKPIRYIITPAKTNQIIVFRDNTYTHYHDM